MESLSDNERYLITLLDEMEKILPGKVSQLSNTLIIRSPGPSENITKFLKNRYRQQNVDEFPDDIIDDLPFAVQGVSEHKDEDEDNDKNGEGEEGHSLQCEGTTKKGMQCKNFPIAGFNYCRLHVPYNQCVAVTQKGARCKKGALRNSDYCSVHG